MCADSCLVDQPGRGLDRPDRPPAEEGDQDRGGQHERRFRRVGAADQADQDDQQQSQREHRKRAPRADVRDQQQHGQKAAQDAARGGEGRDAPGDAPLPWTSRSASRIANGLTQPSSVTGTAKRIRIAAMLPASSPVSKSPSPALANSEHRTRQQRDQPDAERAHRNQPQQREKMRASGRRCRPPSQ